MKYKSHHTVRVKPEDIGIDFEDHPGSFAIIKDNRPDNITVITDHGGSIPVYYSDIKGELSVAKRPEDARTSKTANPIDIVSAVDFIINDTVCYPYSLFENVYACPPGAKTTITPSEVTSEIYYEPREVEAYGSARDWGEQIREAVQGSINKEISPEQNVKILYSGGEDARSVASLLPNNVKAEAVTVADSYNREVKLAKRAAKAQSLDFKFVKRPKDFYKSDLENRAKKVGAGKDIRHTHFTGKIAKSIENADVLVGGYTSDILFKGFRMNNMRKETKLSPQILIKDNFNHPIGIIDAESFEWLNTMYAKAVNDRRMAHHKRLLEIRPTTAGNWQTRWPLSQLDAYSQYLSNLQIGPNVVEPFLTVKSFQVAAQLPDQYRIDRKAFRSAFKNSLGKAAFLTTSSGSVPAIGGYSGKFIKIGMSQFRKFKKITNRKDSQGSWNKDHGGFDITVKKALDDTRSERLGELLHSAFSKSYMKNKTPLEAINALPRQQRLRAIQVGFFLD